MKLLLCAAQIRCTTKRPINPNLTCICSQFGRGNRPGAEDTACAHAVAPRPRRGTSATTGPLFPPCPQDRSGDPCTFYSSCLLPPLHRPPLASSPLPWAPSRHTAHGAPVPPGMTVARRGRSGARVDVYGTSLPLGPPPPSQVSVFSLEKNTCWSGQVPKLAWFWG